MSNRTRASSLGPEARLGRSRSPVRFGPVLNNPRGAMHPGEEKETMRGLNERLAGYLGQVRLLEEANSKLETQIKKVLTERRAAGQRDWSGHEKLVSTLRDQMKEMTMENARLMLQIDNSRLAADDFKVKFEAEMAVRQGVEHDIISLRKMIDDTHMSHMQLESEVEALTEELIFLKKNHEEDVTNVKGQIRDSSVDVQMDAAKGQDIGETIDRIRQQYEKAALKNREETEAWYQSKFETISAEVSRNTDALQQGQSELNDLRRQKQGLEIDLQAMHSMNHSLEDTLNETLGRYSRTMNGHNTVIQQLEAELSDVLAQVTRQGAEYQALLNIKSKLEEEIATYHSLMEGTGLPSHGAADSGLPEIGDFRGMGARDDVGIKYTGLPEDSNVNNNVDDSGIGGNSLGGYDESVEFSLEQALNAGPRYVGPDPTVSNETVEEDMISQKDLELNAANNAINKQYDQKEAGQGTENPVILEEMDPVRVEDEEDEEEIMNQVVEIQEENKEEEDNVAEEETVRPVEDIQVEKEYALSQVEKVEEAVGRVVDVQVKEAVSYVMDVQVKETVSRVEDVQVEETVSPVVDVQVEETVSPVIEPQVEETVSRGVDVQVEETVSPVMKPQVEETVSRVVDVQVEETVSPVMKPQVEETVSRVVDVQVEETVSPGMEPQVEKTVSCVVDVQVEETVSPVVDVQVEETVSPVVDVQVEETVSRVVDVQVEETVSPVVDVQPEEAASPVVDVQVEETVSRVVDVQVEETVSPVMEAQVEETVSRVVDVQVEDMEETMNPVENTQAKEKVEKMNAVEEEKQEREEPWNPEEEPLLNVE